jgi:hypothetical protein
MRKLILTAALLLIAALHCTSQATIQQTTASQNWYWNTTAPATNAPLSQNSPLLNLGARYWNGSVDSADNYSIQNVCPNVSNPQCVLTISHTGRVKCR